MDRSWITALAVRGVTLLAVSGALACASGGGGMDLGNKVWMRDGSTFGAQEAKDRCEPEAMTETDFHLCMQADGYSLETPPAP